MKLHEWLPSQIGQDIWTKKYQFENETLNEWFDRVSGNNQEYKQLMIEKKFLPGGRILANRGLHKLGRKISLSNCYVITPPEDNIESIFECASKLARTYSYGGGCGTDISKLRPKKAKINNAAKNTTGACSFMELYSLTTELIGQNGRRGALMLSLDCDHPDLEEFIDIKKDLNKITKANISIKITDDFMRAVINNEEYQLKFYVPETNEEIIKTVNARKIFRKIAENNWQMAEPGLLFWDRIKNWNLLSEDEEFEYAGVNPCAEEPLPAGGSCLLGSINLSAFIKNPFAKNATFEYEDFIDTVAKSVRFLNNILLEGLPLHPLEEQRQSVNNWRQIGLGVMGIADMLIKLGIRYGSKKAIDFCDNLGKLLIDTAINESALIAKEQGCYPKYKKDAIFKSRFFIENTSDKTKANVEKYGLAHSQLTTIAPTGTLSTMLGISGGIEPIYNFSYTRKTESLFGTEKYYKIYTPIVKEYIDLYKLEDESQLPNYFVNAMQLDYTDRILMQAIWQKHIDASISSTVNVPESFTIEEIEKLYKLAWEMGLKGVTIYRDNCARSGILINSETENGKQNNQNAMIPWGTTIECSDDLIGKKRKIVSGCGNIHVQAWFDPIDGKCLEIFLSKGSTGGCNSFMIGLSRMTSLALRSGANFELVIDQLKSIPTCPSYAVRTAVKHDTSKGNCCPTALANALYDMQQEIFDDLGINENEQNEHNKQKEIKKINKSKEKNINIKSVCPECGESTQITGGCVQCVSCGWSKCS